MASNSNSRLFIFAAKVRWGGVSDEWDESEKPLEEWLEGADFITEAALDTHNLKTSSTIKQDLKTLETHLLRPFFKASQQAKHYQNDYFRQQWILLFGALLTTVIAAITVGIPAAISIEESSRVSTAARMAGVATAIITFVTTLVTYLSQQHQPHYRWYLWRTVAETLRRHYFLYLAHLPPYHTNECAEDLEHNVVLIETQQEGSREPGEEPGAREPHDGGDYIGLTAVYRDKRVLSQLGFYEMRIKENQKNANFVAFAGVTLVALASLLSAVNILFGQQSIVLAIAVLPVIAASLVSFDKVYGWERQVVLYTDAMRRLKIDNTIPPAELPKTPSTEDRAYFERFVTAVESTLQSEVAQWGQSVLKEPPQKLSPDQALDLALKDSSLSPEQIADVRAMFKDSKASNN